MKADDSSAWYVLHEGLFYPHDDVYIPAVNTALLDRVAQLAGQGIRTTKMAPRRLKNKPEFEKIRAAAAYKVAHSGRGITREEFEKAGGKLVLVLA